MQRPRLLSLIGVTLWLAVANGSQRTPAAALSKELRTHLETDRFQIVASIRGLPLGVRDALEKLFGSDSLDIAEPGAAYQETDVVADPQLPTRRLVAAGCSGGGCRVAGVGGGRAHRWVVAVGHWGPAGRRGEWGGIARGGLSTIEDVRKTVLSEGIKGHPRTW